MLQQVEKKTHANKILAEREEVNEVRAVNDALRVSTNVLIMERDSLKGDLEFDRTVSNSYLVSQDMTEFDHSRNTTYLE